ncbi:MAG TPA: hypothetical protein VII06_15980 [Chloroflexota bacterium]|jgi:hypothetical protein
MTKQRIIVGLDAWQLSGSSQFSLYVGMLSRFGVEAMQSHIRIIMSNRRLIRREYDELYQLSGQIAYEDETGWAIDCGIHVIFRNEMRPVGAKLGTFVQARACLVPFDLVGSTQEGAGHVSNPIIYSWRIQHIVARTAMNMRIMDHTGAFKYIVDESSTAYDVVQSTADPVRPSSVLTYLLHCDLEAE